MQVRILPASIGCAMSTDRRVREKSRMCKIITGLGLKADSDIKADGETLRQDAKGRPAGGASIITAVAEERR